MSLQSKIMKHMRKRTTQGQVSMNSFQNQENNGTDVKDLLNQDDFSAAQLKSELGHQLPGPKTSGLIASVCQKINEASGLHEEAESTR